MHGEDLFEVNFKTLFSWMEIEGQGRDPELEALKELELVFWGDEKGRESI